MESLGHGIGSSLYRVPFFMLEIHAIALLVLTFEKYPNEEKNDDKQLSQEIFVKF